MRTSAALRSILWLIALPMRRPPASRPARMPPAEAPAAQSARQSGCGRHSVRPQAPRNPDLRPHLLARPRRQPARRREAQPQPGTLGGLRRPESARVSLGPRRARLSLERSRRPIPRLAGVAGEGGGAMVKAIDAFFAGPGKPDIVPPAESGVASSSRAGRRAGGALGLARS